MKQGHSRRECPCFLSYFILQDKPISHHRDRACKMITPTNYKPLYMKIRLKIVESFE